MQEFCVCKNDLNISIFKSKNGFEDNIISDTGIDVCFRHLKISIKTRDKKYMMAYQHQEKFFWEVNQKNKKVEIVWV